MGTTLDPLKVCAKAPGKVNLYFAVGAVQENGYHPVGSLYAAVDLFEEITVTHGSRAGISLSLDIAPSSVLADMEQNGDFDRSSVPLNEKNLAYRAATAILQEQGINPAEVSLSLNIKKMVPVAGGMAGGSADAAATLRAVNEFVVKAGWVDTELSQERLLQLGAELGADVPFCLMGGLAIGYGVGDELTSVAVPAGTEPLRLTMVLSSRGLSTPAVFQELDSARAAGDLETPVDLQVPQELIEVLTSGATIDPAQVASLVRNDLQIPATRLAPELTRLLKIKQPGIAGAFVSGSGPSIALIQEHGYETGSESLAPGAYTVEVKVLCR